MFVFQIGFAVFFPIFNFPLPGFVKLLLKKEKKMEKEKNDNRYFNVYGTNKGQYYDDDVDDNNNFTIA